MSKKPEWTLDRLADLIISVKDEVTEVKTRVGNVETEVKEVKTEIKEVKTRLGKVESRLDNVETEVKEVREEVKEVREEVKEVKGELKEFKSEFYTFRDATHEEFKKVYKIIHFYHDVPPPPDDEDQNLSVLKKALAYKILEIKTKDEIVSKLNWIATQMKKYKCNAIQFLIEKNIYTTIAPIIKASAFATLYNTTYESIDGLS